MSAMASQITSLKIVYSTFYSGAGERRHQSSASLAFVRGIHRWSVNSPHKGPVTREMFPLDDVIKGAIAVLCILVIKVWATSGSGNCHTKPWTSCLICKIAGCACAGDAGSVFSRHRLQRKLLVSDPGMHHVGITNPRWRGKCFRHSRRMRNPQFYVFGKRPIA